MPRQIQALIPQVAAMGFYKVKTTIDFTAAAWNTVAAHKVFTVVGVVRACVLYDIKTTLTSGGAPTISFGTTSGLTSYAAAQVHTNLVSRKVVVPGGTVGTLSRVTNFVLPSAQNGDVIMTTAENIGYQINTAAMTGGQIDAYCFWTPVSDDASVVAGTGGAP